MQNIEFQNIKLKNVRCHKEGYYEFKNNCLSAIVGKNGKGKSTYFMAFMAGLYGITAEGIELPDLVNKQVGKNLEIEINFKIDNDIYKILRYYKHDLHSNKLILLKNNENISKKTTTDTYDFLSSLLIPKEVFLTVVYFSQQVKDFFTSLTDKKQKEIFYNIFQLHEYKLYYDKVFEQLKVLSEKLSNVQLESTSLTHKIEGYKNSLTLLVQNYNKWLSERELQLKNIDIIIKNFLNDLNLKQQIKSSLSFNEKDLEDITQKITTVKSELAVCQSNIDRLNNKLLEASEELTLKINSQFESKLYAENSKVTKTFDDKLDFLNKEVSENSAKLVKLSEEFNTYSQQKQKELTDKTSNLDQEVKALKKSKQELLDESDKINCDERQQKDLEINFEREKSPIKSRMVSIKTLVEDQNKNVEKNNLLLEQFNSDPKKCPTCGQDVLNDEHILKEKQKVKDSIEKHLKIINDYKTEFLDLKNKYTQLEDKSKEKISAITEDIRKRRYENLFKTNSINQQISSKEDLISHIAESIRSEIKVTSFSNEKLKEDIRKKLEVLKGEITRTNCDKQSGLNAIGDQNRTERDRYLSEQIKLFTESYKTSVNELEVNKKKTELHLKELENSRNSLVNIKEQIIVVNTTISNLEMQLKNSEMNKQELMKQVYDNSQILGLEESVKLTETKLQNINSYEIQLKDEIEILEFWKEGFSDRGIPSMLIDSWIPYLNESVRSELDKIAPGKFVINFDTTSQTKSGDIREKFNISILNLETGADKHCLLSGGEKRQVDVCCMRSLRGLSENLYQKHFNIVLLDEVLDSLDEENAASFCRNLKNLSTGESINLITHAITQNSECDVVHKL
jgi:exonuclease SbcC